MLHSNLCPELQACLSGNKIIYPNSVHSRGDLMKIV